jgi:hypothetical protein
MSILGSGILMSRGSGSLARAMPDSPVTPVVLRRGSAKEIAKFLGCNRTVRALCLRNSRHAQFFSLSEVVTILRALADNTVLESLNIDMIWGESIKLCPSLASALGKMKNVKKLELETNVAVPHNLAALLRGIARNNCLEELHFACATWVLALNWEREPGACADEIEELESALERTNTSFHTLNTESFCRTFLSRRAVFYMKLNKIGRKELLAHFNNVELWLERCILHRDDLSISFWLLNNNPSVMRHLGRLTERQVPSLQGDDSS